MSLAPMTRLEQIALAIFRKVCSDPDAEWSALASEERQDAIEWAQAAMDAAEQQREG